MKIGIISDTHDLLRPEVLSALEGSDWILHGGDISSQKILDQLNAIAPVKAVRGNNDKEWAESIPLYLDFDLAGLRIYMTHKKKDLPKDLYPYNLVIFGHSHKYEEIWLKPKGKTRPLLLNPGSCGPRRFVQPITMAIMTVQEDGFIVKKVDIPHQAKEKRPAAGPDISQQIENVIRETQKGQTVKAVAEKYRMEESLVEQIARLYVTHPGVTVDGIMTKMGL